MNKDKSQGIIRFPYLVALLLSWLLIAFWPPLSTFLLQFGGLN